MNAAPQGLRTLIASGDVYIRAGKLQQIPDADVVCYGLWVDPSLAKNHGVFLSKRETPEVLDFVLQKPSLGGLLRQESARTDCWGGNPAPRCVKNNKRAGSPKPKVAGLPVLSLRTSMPSLIILCDST